MPRKVSDVQDPSKTLTLADASFSLHVADSATTGRFKPGDVIVTVNLNRKRHGDAPPYHVAVSDPQLRAMLIEWLEAADVHDELHALENGGANG